MPDTPTIFPCWGLHQRMGHTTVVGQFVEYKGTSVICTVPELPGDETHEATPGAVKIVPMDGPAFFGFDRLTEEEALAYLVARRPRIYQQRQIETAIEVGRSDDTDDDRQEW